MGKVVTGGTAETLKGSPKTPNRILRCLMFGCMNSIVHSSPDCWERDQ